MYKDEVCIHDEALDKLQDKTLSDNTYSRRAFKLI